MRKTKILRCLRGLFFCLRDLKLLTKTALKGLFEAQTRCLEKERKAEEKTRRKGKKGERDSVGIPVHHENFTKQKLVPQKDWRCRKTLERKQKKTSAPGTCDLLPRVNGKCWEPHASMCPCFDRQHSLIQQRKCLKKLLCVLPTTRTSLALTGGYSILSTYLNDR
jgi:hypothetical protein